MTNRRNIYNQGGYIETRWIYTKQEKGAHNNSNINALHVYFFMVKILSYCTCWDNYLLPTNYQLLQANSVESAAKTNSTLLKITICHNHQTIQR